MKESLEKKAISNNNYLKGFILQKETQEFLKANKVYLVSIVKNTLKTALKK